MAPPSLRVLLPALAILALAGALAACGGEPAPAPEPAETEGCRAGDPGCETPAPTPNPNPATSTPSPTATATGSAPSAAPTATATTPPSATARVATASEVEAGTRTPPATSVATATEAVPEATTVTGTPDRAAAADEPSATREPAPGGEVIPLSGALLELLEEVAAARGLEAPDELRVRLLAPDEMADAYTGLFDDDQREALEQGGALYQLLGYVEPDESLWDVTVATSELVAGFYSWGNKTLWIPSDQQDFDVGALSAEEREILAHEMLHAIQDYHFDLRESGSGATTLDARLAWTSVVEGDAVVHTSRWSEPSTLVPGGGGQGRELLLLANLQQVDGIPPQIVRAFSFPYLTGPVAVEAVVERHGMEALNALFGDPPDATTPIIHTYLLNTDWAPATDIDLLLPAEAIGQSLGEGWTESESGVLGQFHLMNYLAGDRTAYPWPAYGYEGRRFNFTEEAVRRAGAGWEGDSYRIFENGDERVLVVVVRFETLIDAHEFADEHHIATFGGEVAVEDPYTFVTRDDGFVVARLKPVGRTVFFAIGTSAEVARAALEPLVRG